MPARDRRGRLELALMQLLRPEVDPRCHAVQVALRVREGHPREPRGLRMVPVPPRAAGPREQRMRRLTASPRQGLKGVRAEHRLEDGPERAHLIRHEDLGLGRLAGADLALLPAPRDGPHGAGVGIRGRPRQHAHAIATCEALAEGERVRDAARLLLDAVGQLAVEVLARPEAADHVPHVLRRRHDEDLAAPRGDELAEGVVDHRFAADWQQVLVGRARQRMQARSLAASQNDALHVSHSQSVGIGPRTEPP